MVPTLEGCEGKLRRANAHLDTLKAQIGAATSMDSHRFTVDDDPERSQYVIRIWDLVPIDPDWSYVVGDCIQNLRAALDHLAFQLAVLGQSISPIIGSPPNLKIGADLSDEQAASTGFPILRNPSEFPQPGKGRLKLLRSGEYTRVRELQPFHAFDYSIWGESPGNAEWGGLNLPSYAPVYLDALNTLANIDKHRLVHGVRRDAHPFTRPDPPEPFSPADTPDDPLEDSAEIGRWNYPAPRPDPPPAMDMHRYFPVRITLDDLALMEFDAGTLLTAMSQTVELVIEVFRPSIEQGTAPLPLSAL